MAGLFPLQGQSHAPEHSRLPNWQSALEGMNNKLATDCDLQGSSANIANSIAFPPRSTPENSIPAYVVSSLPSSG